MFKDILQKVTQQKTEQVISNDYINAINYYPRVHSVIFGQAGSGKSTYALSVLRHLKNNKLINNYFYVDYDSKALDEVKDVLNQSTAEGWGYVSTLIPEIANAYGSSYKTLLYEVIDSLEDNSIVLLDTMSHLIDKTNDKDELKFLWKDLKLKLAKTNSYLMVIGHSGKNLDLGLVGSVHIESEVTYMTKLERNGRATIWKDSNGTNTNKHFDISISDGDTFAKRTAKVSDIYDANDIVPELNEKEVREMYKIDLLKAKYVELLLPTIEKYWDNIEGQKTIKMINVASTIKLGLKLFNVGEETKTNILSPSFIQANSKLVLESMFNIEAIKLSKSKSGRPIDFIQYITSNTLLNSLSEEVLSIMGYVNIVRLPHVIVEFNDKLTVNHPTKKVVASKIIEVNKLLTDSECESIENILRSVFCGRTDLSTLIKYLYKTVKLLSQRKARAGINWLVATGKLQSNLVGRTTFISLDEEVK
ncbi:MAG: hypothetical protein U9Q66_03420 [Patescibacteria group bacterium]|nr:hypothetical protein [Patescibacteria group bacterium]